MLASASSASFVKQPSLASRAASSRFSQVEQVDSATVLPREASLFMRSVTSAAKASGTFAAPPGPRSRSGSIVQGLEAKPSFAGEPAVQVSPIELANLRRIFRQFDADGSNTIDVQELSQVMTSLGVQMDDEQLRLLVEQVTGEGETELKFETFVDLILLWKEAAQYKLFDGDTFKSLAQQHVEAALESASLVPDSPLVAAWDTVVCIVAVLYWIFVLLFDAYEVAAFDAGGLIAGDVIGTAILVADIVISARTSFTRDGRTIDDSNEVWLEYRRSWLVPDTLAALPLDLILTASGARTAALVLRHLRLIKLAKLPRLWRTSDVTPITSAYITFHFHFLPILQLLIAFVIITHGFATVLVLIKQSRCDDPLVSTSNVTGLCTFPYVPAVYFVIYTLSTVGFGDVRIRGESEHWFACAVLVGALGVNGLVVAKLVEILQRADIKKEQRTKIRETLAVLEHYRIAPQLQAEVLRFQSHAFENNLGAAYESIVSDLPAEMRTNISLFVRMKLVTAVPLFSESHFVLRVAVAQALTNSVVRPEQYMCVAGQLVDGLVFIAYGFADWYDEDDAYTRTLRSGDFFGEQALLGSGRVDMSVKALTYCDVWILSEEVFSGILARFPKFRRVVALLRGVDHAKSLAAATARESMRRAESARKGATPGAAPAATDAPAAAAAADRGPANATAVAISETRVEMVHVESPDGSAQVSAALSPAGSFGHGVAPAVPQRQNGAEPPSISVVSPGDQLAVPAPQARARRASAVTFQKSARGSRVFGSAQGAFKVSAAKRADSPDDGQPPPPRMAVREIEHLLGQVRRFRQQLAAQ
jgi:CRP-like cAMP-binding protein